MVAAGLKIPGNPSWGHAPGRIACCIVDVKNVYILWLRNMIGSLLVGHTELATPEQSLQKLQAVGKETNSEIRDLADG